MELARMARETEKDRIARAVFMDRFEDEGDRCTCGHTRGEHTEQGERCEARACACPGFEFAGEGARDVR